MMDLCAPVVDDAENGETQTGSGQVQTDVN